VLIAGIVLLVVAVGAVLYARHERGKARKATATETMSCGDIAALSDGVASEVGAGDFTQRCEAVGAAKAGPHGLVDAPESGLDAVWVRTKIVHKYWEMVETRNDGRTTRTRQEREETVSENTSTTPFALSDDSGTVLIHPEGADIDRPEQVVDRFEQRSGAERAGDGFLAALLRSGQDSYVQGEVADRTGALVFEQPRDKGAFLISTRSEEEIVQGAERNAKIATAGAAVAGVLGLVLLVAGALA
jgi:hypothetical protein